MKRLVELQGYVDALSRDIAFQYSKVSEWRRDSSRLRHETEVRGLRLLAVDLPSISKHFDWCLGQGQYTPSGLPLTACRKGVQVPRFMEDLYLQVFDHDGKLRSDPCPNAVLVIRQVLKGFSKLKILCPDKEIRNEVRNFRLNEADLRTPSLDWLGDHLYHCGTDGVRPSFTDIREADSRQPDLWGEPSVGTPGARSGLLTTLERVCDFVANELGNFHQEIDGEYQVTPKHGKGRVADQAKGGDKYLFPSWSPKLEAQFPYAEYGCTSYNQFLDYRESGLLPASHEAASKLIAVPKTFSGPRLIASEPTSGQWCQQLILKQLVKSVENSFLNECIDFSDQTHNQRLAEKASKDGSFATVDLKSASDRLSLWTIERALRVQRPLLERLHASRTRYIRNEIDPYQWDYILLKKAFSQGNACTFPVQTLVYTMFCIAAVIISRGENPTRRNIVNASLSVRVFGDDLIIESSAFEVLSEILSLNQLKINPTKTFPKGAFRESCGFDAFQGYNVTPVYIKQATEEPDHELVVSAVQSSNNLMRQGWFNLAKWQEGIIGSKAGKLPFQGPSSDEFGLTSFSGYGINHLKQRWNPALHREEVLSLTLRSKTTKKKSDLYSSLFQYFTERPEPTTKWDSGSIVKTSSVLRKTWISTQPSSSGR